MTCTPSMRQPCPSCFLKCNACNTLSYLACCCCAAAATAAISHVNDQVTLTATNAPPLTLPTPCRSCCRCWPHRLLLLLLSLCRQPACAAHADVHSFQHQPVSVHLNNPVAVPARRCLNHTRQHHVVHPSFIHKVPILVCVASNGGHNRPRVSAQHCQDFFVVPHQAGWRAGVGTDGEVGAHHHLLPLLLRCLQVPTRKQAQRSSQPCCQCWE